MSKQAKDTIQDGKPPTSDQRYNLRSRRQAEDDYVPSPQYMQAGRSAASNSASLDASSDSSAVLPGREAGLTASSTSAPQDEAVSSGVSSGQEAGLSASSHTTGQDNQDKDFNLFESLPFQNTMDFQDLGPSSRRSSMSDVFPLHRPTKVADTAPSTSRPIPPNAGGDFLATEETPPVDVNLYASHFSVPLNETADDYIRHRDFMRLRRIEIDMVLGALAAANVDDVISVGDITDFTSRTISAQGVSSIDYIANGNHVEAIATTAAGQERVEFQLSDISPSNETTLVNGLIAPYLTPEEGVTRVDLPSTTAEETQCPICANPDTEYQLYTRHPKETIKHVLAHKSRTLRGRASGGIYVDTFSAEIELQNSSYGRQYNFLPTASDLREAVDIIRRDDAPIPARQLRGSELILQAIEMIEAFTLSKQMIFYYLLLKANYDVYGSTIRHVRLTE